MFIPDKNDLGCHLSPPPIGRYYVYGWKQSYFTRKLEAAMTFYGAHYESRRIDQSMKQEVRYRSGTHQIPVLHTAENWMIARLYCSGWKSLVCWKFMASLLIELFPTVKLRGFYFQRCVFRDLYRLDKQTGQTPMRKTLLTFTATLLISGCFDKESSENTRSITDDYSVSKCDKLINTELPHGRVILASNIPAGPYKTPDGKTYTLPAFCRAQGIAQPSNDSNIHFELWLPSENWNGRYYQLGNGGFSGAIHYGPLAASLQQGSAVASTDDGHQAGGLDATWALGHPEKVKDWGHRALKVTADNAKSMLLAFYGKPARHRYFSGCSTGGRQALMAAQRYPEDWEGILVGAPSSLEQFIGFAWNESVILGKKGSSIAPQKIPAIQQAALRQCTSKTQVINGIATDPRHCRFDPDMLMCSAEENDACLTAAQAAALKKLYQGPRLQEGGQLYPGYEPTMEAERWSTSILSDPPEQAVQFRYGRQFLSNIVYGDAGWRTNPFDLDAVWNDVKQQLILGESLDSVMNSRDPNLHKLQQSGGKVLMYFGWGDSLVAPQSGINYYNKVKTAVGTSNTEDFFRLFMVPGMAHCMAGPGSNAFGQIFALPALKDDADHSVVRALERWVEEGRAPERIIATKYHNESPEQGVEATRPLCPYPQVSFYLGSGDPQSAQHYACRLGDDLK